MFEEAVVFILVEHQVIEQLDPEDLPGPLDFAGNRAVVGARGQVAAGVIVRDNDRGGAIGHGTGKHFAGMNVNPIHQADGDRVDGEHFVGGVEGNAEQVFLLFGADVTSTLAIFMFLEFKLLNA